MLGVLARFGRRLCAAYHALRGRLAWRLRFSRSARRHFERVLALGGDEFTAYVHLARIALGDGDYAGYRREMSNARGCDPDRFARLRIPTEGLEPRVAGTPFEETGQRATWRSVRPGGGLARRPAVRSAELPTDFDDLRFGVTESYEALEGDPFDRDGMGRDALDRDALDRAFDATFLSSNPDGASPRDRDGPRRDDFCTAVERERFRRLPPIGRDEVRAADVDELIRRLGC